MFNGEKVIDQEKTFCALSLIYTIVIVNLETIRQLRFWLQKETKGFDFTLEMFHVWLYMLNSSRLDDRSLSERC